MKLALLTTRIALLALGFSLVFTKVAEAKQGQDTVILQSPSASSITAANANGSDKTKASSPGAAGKTDPVIKAKAATVAKTEKTGPAAKATAPAVDSTKIPEAEQLVLQSRDISSFGPQWQVFSDYLTVPKGSGDMPLSLVVINGSGSGIPFQDLRIGLAGKSLATVKDFKGQPLTLTKKLTGALGVGDSLLTVQAYGPMGAKLKWKFVTRKIIATKVNPSSFGPTDKVIIEGRNFSDKISGNQVLIGDKTATIVSAKSTSLEIKPPTGLLSGKANLVVVVGTRKSAPLSVTIKGAPEIDSIGNISTAPGQPLVITGKGFSPIASENQVMFGSYSAQVTSCTPTSIECIVPLALDSVSPVWDVPIKVKTNGMSSTDPQNVSKINIQLRVF